MKKVDPLNYDSAKYQCVVDRGTVLYLKNRHNNEYFLFMPYRIENPWVSKSPTDYHMTHKTLKEAKECFPGLLVGFVDYLRQRNKLYDSQIESLVRQQHINDDVTKQINQLKYVLGG